MMFRGFKGKKYGFALLGFVLLAGCQSGNPLGSLNRAPQQQPQPSAEGVTASELRAFCPNVTLRENTAYYTTYQGGAQGEASKVIYQASITDVTRSCSYQGGVMGMTIAVAGKIVPGPLGSVGTINLPLRIQVAQGTGMIYEQVHDFQVAVTDTAGATQFLFTDSSFSMPTPNASVLAFAGFARESDD